MTESQGRTKTRYRSLAVVGVLLGVVLLINTGLEYGHEEYSCAMCGARQRVSYIIFFGLRHHRKEAVDEGFISRLIQKHNGSICCHDWERSHGVSGYLFSRRPHCLGPGFTRYKIVQVFETFPEWYAPLEQLVESNPDKLRELKQAVAEGDVAWFEELAKLLDGG